MQQEPNTPPTENSADQPDASAQTRPLSARIGSVLYVLRTLIAHARFFAATVSTRVDRPEFAVAAAVFGTYNLTTIMFRVQRGIRRALALQRYLLARAGRREDALRALEELKRLAPRNAPASIESAQIYLGLGDREVGLLFENLHGLARAVVTDSLFARERLGSTGLGHGVAIPHGRIKGLKDAIGAFLRLSNPVPFDAPDGKPVHVRRVENAADARSCHVLFIPDSSSTNLPALARGLASQPVLIVSDAGGRAERPRNLRKT